MRGSAIAFSVLVATQPVFSQQIYDIYETKWDRSKLFTYFQPSGGPIDFVTPGPIGSADIVITDSNVYQSVVGFGGSLTDSSAQVLSGLKTTNPTNYNTLLKTMFDPSDSDYNAGITWIRVPIGASDFSSNVYSWDDNSGDTSFSKLSITAPSYVLSTLKDIQAVNSLIKIQLVPWSPPAWTKTTGTMDGGSLSSTYISEYATYLFKAVQAMENAGFPVYAISIQNEPENSDTTYPSCSLSVAQEAQIGTALKSLLKASSTLNGVKVLGFEHNWSDASSYAVPLLQQAPTLDGVSFHCYEGDVADQDNFYNAFPNKEIFFTECTGTLGSDWWSDIKWYMDNIFVGTVQNHASAASMWNIALNGNGDPELPGSDSCNGGCRGIVTVNSDGSYELNQEFYAMAQASKAILPKDVGGPWGQYIEVTVGGSLSWALIVSAFVTGRVSSTDWLRYSIVVLNWDDSSTTTWNPVAVEATIEFRGAQAQYTFDVGVTTLWWYAPALSSKRAEDENIVFGNSSTSSNGTHFEFAGSSHEPIAAGKRRTD